MELIHFILSKLVKGWLWSVVALPLWNSGNSNFGRNHYMYYRNYSDSGKDWNYLRQLPSRNITLQWRHNGYDGVPNHQPHDCLLNRLSGAEQRKHQSSASLAFVQGIHRWLVNSPPKWPVTRKMFPFDDIIMFWSNCKHCTSCTSRNPVFIITISTISYHHLKSLSTHVFIEAFNINGGIFLV